MLVSHRRRFIYLKTTKTASTSVEVLFERECLPEGEYAGPTHESFERVSEAGIVGARLSGAKTPGAQWLPHMAASQVREKLGPEIFDSYLKFCVVRNPYDKVVSQFWWQLKDRNATMAARDFADIRKAFNWWVNTGGNLSPDRDKLTVNGQICIDHFLRYERLWPDVAELCAKLGIERCPSDLGSYKSENRKRPEPFQAYYEPAAARRVARVFKWKIERFGYSL